MIEEIWRHISEFPQYSISNYGRVFDNFRSQHMATSQTNHGHVKIGLWGTKQNKDGEVEPFRYTRSVALLVAQAFIELPDRYADHVIILDGNLQNVTAWNLAWRPAWFAWKYSHQLRTQQPLAFQNLRVQNVTRGFLYRSIIEAGMTEGLLFEDVWRSTYSDARIYPHRCLYRVVERV